MTATERRPADLDQRIEWMRAGEALLAAQLDGLTLSEPSVLPGWTRAHVAAHLAGNATALGNLLTWARTGVETPMYTSPADRLRAIDELAQRPDSEVAMRVADSAATLAAAADGLPAAAWSATVRSALGRDIPATDVPWLRTREVWIHSVDLAAALTFADLPVELVDALLTDVCAALGAKDGCPNYLVVPDDRVRTWSLGAGVSPALPVTGAAADLLAWVTGRPVADRTEGWPDLPSWL